MKLFEPTANRRIVLPRFVLGRRQLRLRYSRPRRELALTFRRICEGGGVLKIYLLLGPGLRSFCVIPCFGDHLRAP